MNSITRKVTITAVALVGAFALTACSTPSDTASSGSTTLSREDSSTSSYSFAEQTLVEVYEGEYGNVDTETEGLVIDIAQASCESLDAGLTFEDIAMIAYDTGMDMEEAGFIVGAGVAAFCPEYTEYMMDTVSQYV